MSGPIPSGLDKRRKHVLKRKPKQYRGLTGVLIGFLKGILKGIYKSSLNKDHGGFL